jgi:hypothetical protein
MACDSVSRGCPWTSRGLRLERVEITDGYEYLHGCLSGGVAVELEEHA